jgi:hypothetical protein
MSGASEIGGFVTRDVEREIDAILAARKQQLRLAGQGADAEKRKRDARHLRFVKARSTIVTPTLRVIADALVARGIKATVAEGVTLQLEPVATLTVEEAAQKAILCITDAEDGLAAAFGSYDGRTMPPRCSGPVREAWVRAMALTLIRAAFLATR